MNLSILDKEFTDKGIFSDFVLGILAKDKQAIDNAIVGHANEIKELNIGQPGVFMIALRNLVYKSYGIRIENQTDIKFEKVYKNDRKSGGNRQNDFNTEFNELIDNFQGKTKREKEKKEGYKIKLYPLSQFIKRPNIKEQIFWIKKNIEKNKIEKAKRAILRLIEFQDLYSNAEHLCKSLCSIAGSFQKINYFEYSDLIANKSVDLNPHDPVPHCIIAENYRIKGELDIALHKYKTTLMSYPDDAFSRCGYAETLRQMGRLEEALEAYQETILLFKEDVVARSGKAETLRQMGCLEQALQVYEETISIYNDVYARNGKAETLRQMGHLEQALQVYEETISIFNDIYARNGKAETLKQMGKLKEALNTYNETISSFKNDVWARYGKAEVLRQMGRLKHASHQYEKIMNDFPYSEFAKRARIVILIQLGNNWEQLEHDTLVNNPQTLDDWKLNHIHCMLLIRQNKFDEAIPKLKDGLNKIEDIKSRNYYINSLSYAYIRNKEYKLAISHLKTEVDIEPVLKVLVTHAYAGEGNIEESQKHLASIYQSEISKIDEASKLLSDRYSLLSKHFFSGKSENELDLEIENLEFELLTASYSIENRESKVLTESYLIAA